MVVLLLLTELKEQNTQGGGVALVFECIRGGEVRTLLTPYALCPVRQCCEHTHPCMHCLAFLLL